MRFFIDRWWGLIRRLVQNPRLSIAKMVGVILRGGHLQDEAYLHLIYMAALGRRLDLKSPTTFNEKLQWLKLYDRNPLYCKLVDKYEVKKWVANKIGSEHVVPTLGVWDSFTDIDFEALPKQFVLKCTHDSGGLVICRDKCSLNMDSTRRRIGRSLKKNYYYATREWPYKKVPPRIIAEVFLPDPPQSSATTKDGSTESKLKGIIDYKFYCFHGEPRFLYVSQGLEDHDTARVSFLELNWKRAAFSRSDYKEFDRIPPKPNGYPEMIRIARILSQGIPFVRVDLFENSGTVLFSEMTFYPVGGLMSFVPAEADHEIGRYLDLEKCKA